MKPGLAATAAYVASRLALTALDRLAHQLEAGAPLASLRTLVPAATFTAAVDELASAAEGVTTREIAIALRSAAAAHALDRDRTVELVWTGPATPRLPVRMSAQALRQVIEQARDRLIVASFAVYDVDEVANALLAAAERGVRVDLVLESVAESGGKISFEGASQLERPCSRGASSTLGHLLGGRWRMTVLQLCTQSSRLQTVGGS